MHLHRLSVLINPLVAVAGMLPGFVFPFVLTAVLGQQVSDPFFLSVSVSLVLTNILANTIELNTVVQIGRVRARTGRVSRRSVRRYRRKVRVFLFSAVLVGGSILIGIYGLSLSAEAFLPFLSIALITIVIPLVGGEASIRSGQLIACGQQRIPILMQSARSIFPLFILLIWQDVPTSAVAASMVLGEVVRLTVMARLAALVEEPAVGHTVAFETRGLLVQSVSTSAVQLAPVADRIFLSSAPTGSLSSYELADKLFFAGAQFLNLSYLVSRVKRWSELPSTPSALGRQILRRDFGVLTVFSVSCSAIAVVALVFLERFVFLPPEWNQGLQWSKWILMSLPFALISMACSRLLVVAGRQSFLLWFAASIAIATTFSDWLLFANLGAIGVPIAGVGVRVVSSCVYLFVTLKCILPVLGADLDEGNATLKVAIDPQDSVNKTSIRAR